jgi:hypothetical protein
MGLCCPAQVNALLHYRRGSTVPSSSMQPPSAALAGALAPTVQPFPVDLSEQQRSSAHCGTCAAHALVKKNE